VSVTHAHVSALPDDPTKDVSSSEWNDPHTGTIDDTMHGVRATANAHGHADLSGVSANQHHPQLHHAAHEPAGSDAMAVDQAAATGSLRTLGSGSAQAASGDHAHAAAPLLEGFYDPGSTTVETEHFVVHRDHLKLSSAGRLTLEGTSRVYERDLGENSYGPQGELADRGFVVMGTPKVPTISFLVPTDYQYQLLNRLALRGTMRSSLLGTADLYIENDAPRGGRIIMAGKGVDASG
jgi:hypothetical protein